MSSSPFPNYTQMRRYLPVSVWNGMRLVSVGLAIGIIMTLFVRPELGLFIVWRVIIPFVPLLFFIAPGVWRNICPLAAANQTPRVFEFTRAVTAPAWLKEYGYVIGIGLFAALVSLRKVLFNYNGAALGVLLLLLLGGALVMGTFYKGKSGWCSSICPLLPVQRIYGQTPFVKVANSHCQPCVGCTKNCYDFNPHVAYLADMYDTQDKFAMYRKFFVGMFPGFIAAFYLLPSPGAANNADAVIVPNFWTIPATISVAQMYLLFALFSLSSVGAFYLFHSFLKVTVPKITTIFGAVALNLYYWYNAPVIAELFGSAVAATWIVRAVVLALTLVWIVRTYQKEPIYLESLQSVESISVNQSLVAHRGANVGKPEVFFKNKNKRVVVKPGKTVLEIAEANELPIESGCRMGVCGADPITVLNGAENLNKVGSDERTTLERLGVGENCRMACMTRVKGNCTISLKPEAPKVFTTSMVQGFKYDRSVEKVVIVGNGIAGVTAADHVRRRHPTCEIHLIGRESHHLYNRMGITRLIYGRSAMEGLYLMPEKWYKDYQITVWLNTHVEAIDADGKAIKLGTGESLAYDRLILTTGSHSWVPPIENYGLDGCFVLREAEDAIQIRRFIQEKRCKTAVVAGGGLLGLEAAYGLVKLGLSVSVLERGGSLLRRQLDAEGGRYLQAYLEGLGMTIVTNASASAVNGDDRLKSVTLQDERELPCDLLLVATGIRSNISLGKDVGLSINRGIVVNERMETSLQNVYAAGDSAEFNQKTFGLWTVAVAQGEVAAANAVGGDETYTEIVPVTMLKVAGIDLTSIGRINTEDGDEEIVNRDPDNHRYRKLITQNNKIVGAILIGYPDEARGVSEAVKGGLDVNHLLAAVRKGDWKGLIELAA